MTRIPVSPLPQHDELHEKYGRRVYLLAVSEGYELTLFREDDQKVRRWEVTDRQEADRVISDWFDWSIEAVANLDADGKPIR